MPLFLKFDGYAFNPLNPYPPSPSTRYRSSTHRIRLGHRSRLHQVGRVELQRVRGVSRLRQPSLRTVLPHPGRVLQVGIVPPLGALSVVLYAGRGEDGREGRVRPAGENPGSDD